MCRADGPARRNQTRQRLDPGQQTVWKLDDFFLPAAAWATTRQEFFRKAGLPAEATPAAAYLTARLHTA